MIKIISGGQTGVDKIALKTATANGLETGGYAAYAYLTLEGVDFELKDLYHLTPLPDYGSIAQNYVKRSIANVDAADGTLVFRFKSSIGTDKTIGYCLTKKWVTIPISSALQLMKQNKCLIITNFDEYTVGKIISFIRDNNIKILNVAGHRYEQTEDIFFQKVESTLNSVFQQLK